MMIFNAKGELLGCSPQSRVHTGAACKAVQVVREEFSAGRLADGALFDWERSAFTGSMHANDFQGAVARISSRTIASDFATSTPYARRRRYVPGGWGVGATDRYGEAFRMPFVKYVEAGRFNETVQRILVKNTRLPAAMLNDIETWW